MAEPVVLSIVIPGEPVSKERPRVARGRAYTPAGTREAEERIRWLLRAKRVTVNDRALFAVDVRFYAVNKLKDGDNMLKLILDAFSGQVWKNDRQVAMKVARVFRVNASPRTEVDVWITDGEDERPYFPLLRCVDAAAVEG